jgi:hypothetical protein
MYISMHTFISRLKWVSRLYAAHDDFVNACVHVFDMLVVYRFECTLAVYTHGLSFLIYIVV